MKPIVFAAIGVCALILLMFWGLWRLTKSNSRLYTEVRLVKINCQTGKRTNEKWWPISHLGLLTEELQDLRETQDSSVYSFSLEYR